MTLKFKKWGHTNKKKRLLSKCHIKINTACLSDVHTRSRGIQHFEKQLCNITAKRNAIGHDSTKSNYIQGIPKTSTFTPNKLKRINFRSPLCTQNQ